MGNTKSTPKVKPILFNRFKKKSLTLLYKLFPEDLEILGTIRNKKINLCILKENYRYNKSGYISIKFGQNETRFTSILLKINPSQIISICHQSLKLWDLKTGNQIKTLVIDKLKNKVDIQQLK